MKPSQPMSGLVEHSFEESSNPHRQRLPARAINQAAQLPELSRSVRVRNTGAIMTLIMLSVALSPGTLCTAQNTSKSYLCGWYVQPKAVDAAVAHASEYPVNALFLLGDSSVSSGCCAGGWSAVVEELTFHDDYPKIAKHGAERETAEKVRAEYRSYAQKSKAAHLAFYLNVGEMVYPKDLFEKYPEMRDPDKDAIWQFIESRAEEAFTAIPEMEGMILGLDDQVAHEVYDLQGRQSVEDYIVRLLTVYLKVCEAQNKQLLVSTLTNYYPERLEALIRAIRRVPPSSHFAVLNDSCPSDWGLIAVLNPAIGRVGGHREILNFDFSGENWGQSLVPLGELDHVADCFRKARARGANIAGVSGWVHWWIPQSVFGTPSEVNLFGMTRILEDADADPAELYQQWLGRKYGKAAAPLLVPAYRRSFDVAIQSREVLGFWAMEYPKSEFAPVQWLDYSMRANSPAVWDENFRPVEYELFNPDERALMDVLREKDKAAAQAQAAVDAVESVRNLIPSNQYESLLKPFIRARDEARAMRPYYELFFRYKMWTLDHQVARLDRMQDLEQQIRGWADYFEQNYPNDPLHNALSLREYADQVQGLLAGANLPRVTVTW